MRRGKNVRIASTKNYVSQVPQQLQYLCQSTAPAPSSLFTMKNKLMSRSGGIVIIGIPF